MKQDSGEALVNARLMRHAVVLLLASGVLTAAAVLRSAEYDEQYTLFLTAGVARPAWPDAPFRAGEVQRLQAGQGSLRGIARDLRATDVHPPLYFWAVALWRRLFGPSLLAARLLSVACSLVALAAVGGIAVRSGIPPALAMLLTLGCYGFAYTGLIARGFALAQALTLAGVLVLLHARGRRRGLLLAGTLLGAAAASNYLAVFVGGAVILVTPPPPSRKGRKRSLWAGLGLAPWLVLDLWFFAAQRGSRSGQFPAFHLGDALHRLVTYAAANLFGGLPLYVAPDLRPSANIALAAMLLCLAALVASRVRHIGTCTCTRCLLAAAMAPPFGLLLLGLVFNTTPIELRYLAFATPFAALLLAGALASLSRLPRRGIASLVIAVQIAALAGLLTRPETMQPARAAARAVAPLATHAVVLLPRGNDGVGIVGAFAIESPPGTLLLAVDPATSLAQIRRRAATYRRVVLALLAQDAASKAALPHMLAAFDTPCWRRIAQRSNLTAFARVCHLE